MGLSNRFRAAICAVAGILALTGCGMTTVEGQAETTKAQAGEPTFDPCSIPEDALRAAGVDPATQSRDIVGVKQPGWSLCRWRGPDYFVTIFAAGRPLDDILANPRFHDVTPVDVDGREAFTVRESNDTRNEYCDVAFPSGPDAIMIKSTYFKGLPASDSPCPLAVRNAEALAPSIPH